MLFCRQRKGTFFYTCSIALLRDDTPFRKKMVFSFKANTIETTKNRKNVSNKSEK